MAKTATIDTSKGTIVADLFDTETPNTVANFEKLANSEFYDGTRFHRVIDELHDPGRRPALQGPQQPPGRHRRPGLQDQVRDAPQHAQARGRHALAWRTRARTPAAASSSSATRPSRTSTRCTRSSARCAKGMDVVNGIKQNDVITSIRVA